MGRVRKPIQDSLAIITWCLCVQVCVKIYYMGEIFTQVLCINVRSVVFNCLQCYAFQTNGMTHRGRMRHSFGGVGRNIADCLSRLGMDPLFISAVGNDWMGKHFRECFTHMV